VKIRPRITPYLKAPDPECLQMCRLYCLLFIEDPLGLFLCVVGCIQTAQREEPSEEGADRCSCGSCPRLITSRSTDANADAMSSATAARIVRLWSAKIAYAVPTKKLKDPFGCAPSM
jgi:hypothetical protein